MKKMYFLIFISILYLLPSEVYANINRMILQHANASNGHITIEQVAAGFGGVTNRWYAFHFWGPPVATRSQVQTWANNRREYYRTNFRSYLSEWELRDIQSAWDLQHRWYFTILNASGEILDSGFLYNNNQIVWDNNAEFLTHEDWLNAAFELRIVRGHPRSYTPSNMLTLDGSLGNRRELS